MTDDTSDTDNTDGFRPKPPLWRPKGAAAPRNRWMDALVIAACLGLIALAGFGGERLLFSTSPVRVPVTIQKMDGIDQDGDSPPSYSYSVLLPDGSRASYSSARIHRQGEHHALLVPRPHHGPQSHVRSCTRRGRPWRAMISVAMKSRTTRLSRHGTSSLVLALSVRGSNAR
jgi:hypothetical protein